jgi:hypothetical protein
MKHNGICKRGIGVLFVVLLLIIGSFSIDNLPTNVGDSNTIKNQTGFAANNKDQKAKSLYYKYYMILKARNKMHKV